MLANITLFIRINAQQITLPWGMLRLPPEHEKKVVEIITYNYYNVATNM